LPVDIARVGREIRGAAWHADDTIVFATEEGLFRVPAAGGTAVAFAKPEAARDEQIYGWPQFLPGGKTIVFVIRSAGPGQDAIAVVPLAGGTPKVVIPRGMDPRWSPTGHLLYADGGVLRAVAFDVDALETRGESVPLIEGVPLKPFGAVSFAIAGDGTLAYLGSSRAVGRRLAWVDRNGARETLPAPPRGYTVPRISPDGTRIAVEIREQTPAIWIWDIARAALTRFTDGLRGDGFPAWTPDGKTIVFGSTRTGRPNVFAQAADGSGTARHLFEHARADNPVSVTPDGTQILFRRDSGLDAQSNKFDIMIGPIAGGPAKPLRATRAHEVNAEVSPDGRWLAYDSNEAGDETQVFVRPFPNVDGGRWQVSNAGGKQPAWRADGRELFYLTSDGKIAAVTVGPGASFSAGPPSVIVSPSLPPFSEVAPRLYDVTRDGRRFLVVEEGAANDANRAMTVVINFAEELKRLTTGR
jgi:serine/threonine-protein kinase